VELQTNQRVRALFDEVVRLPRDARQTWLSSLRGEDRSTIAEVASLLASFDDAGDFLAEPRPDETTMLEPPGARVGQFVIRQHIGAGGFGDVYLAEQHEPVRRRVALKIIKPGMDSREVLARFRAERHTLAMLDHPGIARIIDGGATPAGRPYYVMELVDGTRITRWCDERRLPLRQRVELLLGVCDAVQHAHQRGVIHRDLKPANVLVTEVDGKPLPKVIDFGVAKVLRGDDGAADAHTMLTVQPRAVGTPAYMSPEQTRGEAVDTRTDVYSVGVLLYELLCGRLPFDASAPRDPYADAPPMTQRVAHAAAAPARELTGELQWIVGRCLRGEREERYPTVNALADDLRAYLAGQPVTAAPPSRAYRARKFVARHKGGVAASAAMLLLLIAGVIITSWLAVRATRAERLAERRRQDAEAANARSTAVNKFLTRDVIRSADPFVTPGNRELTMRQALDNAAKVLANRFKDDPLTEAAVRESVGMAYLHLGHPELGQPHGLRTLELRKQALGDAHADTIAAVNYYAAILKALGKYAEVEALCGPALDAARRGLGEDHAQTLMLLDSYADSLVNLGRYAEAEPLARQAWEQSRRALGPDSPRTLTAMSNYGRVLQLQGRFAEAEPVFRDVLAGGLRIDSPDAPQNLTAMNNLALILSALARFEESEALYKDVLRRRRRTLGEDHPQTLNSMGTYALLLERLARHDEAEPLAREALERSRRARGAGHPDTLRATNNLASVLRAAGRAAEAEPLAREALERRRGALGEDHPETVQSLINYAVTLQALDRDADAEPVLRRALELRRAKLGEDHPLTRAAVSSHARALSKLGRADEAAALARRAMESARRTLGDDHPNTAKLTNNFAELLNAAGRRDEALALFRDVTDIYRRTLGLDHPDTLDAIGAAAGVLVAQGRDAEAEALLAEVYRAAPASKLSPTGAALAMAGYGPCLARLGRYPEAEGPLRESLRRLRETNQLAHAKTRDVLAALAEVCDHTSRPDEAAALRAELRATPPQTAPASQPAGV
jgi:non-specific serine/threonine protein kinase/serine/threonine-protein kinase